MTEDRIVSRRLLARLLKDFLPPIAVRYASALVSRQEPAPGRVIDFVHGFDSWESASEECGGYDADEIIGRVTASARLVHSGQAVYERDSVLFDRIEYSWPLLASLLLAAADCGRLRVVDFGGALGTTYQQNRRFLSQLKCPISWRVVEQQKFVEIGSREFETHVLSFHRTIDEARKDGVDVIVFGGVIGYVPEPASVIREAIAAAPRYIVFDRTSVVETDRDIFAVQHVRPPIYSASYPVRIFARRNLLNHLADDYVLVEDWLCDLQPDSASRQAGFLFRIRTSLADAAEFASTRNGSPPR